MSQKKTANQKNLPGCSNPQPRGDGVRLNRAFKNAASCINVRNARPEYLFKPCTKIFVPIDIGVSIHGNSGVYAKFIEFIGNLYDVLCSVHPRNSGSGFGASAPGIIQAVKFTFKMGVTRGTGRKTIFQPLLFSFLVDLFFVSF